MSGRFAPAEAALDLLITAFKAPRDPAVSAWGRQVPVLMHERLARIEGVRARLAIDGVEPPPKLRPHEVVLAGAVSGGEQVALTIRLHRGQDGEPILVREERFGARSLFRRLDELAADVARALGARLAPAPVLSYETSFPALRDWLRAIDLSEDPDLPLELEDRRRKLEWLLLAVEADPHFQPAADALLEAGLRAHESGLCRESRRALELLARLAPRDGRATYVLGELALLYGSADEAAAQFRRCVARDPGHAGASFRLGMLADEEGDREAAKGHFRLAGCGSSGRRSLEALLLLGILHAEDGERDAADEAWKRAAELDPSGQAGVLARVELMRSEAARSAIVRGERGDMRFAPSRRRSRPRKK